MDSAGKICLPAPSCPLPRYIHPHAGPAGTQEAEFFGGAFGDIDDAAANKRTAIIHAQNYCATIAQVGNFNMGAKSQGAMGGGHGVWAGAFATGGA